MWEEGGGISTEVSASGCCSGAALDRFADQDIDKDADAEGGSEGEEEEVSGLGNCGPVLWAWLDWVSSGEGILESLEVDEEVDGVGRGYR